MHSKWHIIYNSVWPVQLQLLEKKVDATYFTLTELFPTYISVTRVLTTIGEVGIIITILKVRKLKTTETFDKCHFIYSFNILLSIKPMVNQEPTKGPGIQR